MRDPSDMSTFIFAAVAVVVLWKLWSVLGAKTGTERPRGRPETKMPPKADTPPGGNVIRLPGAAASPVVQPAQIDAERWNGIAEPGSAVWTGLDAIVAADPAFAPQAFMAGAKIAYENIITAFSAGERKVLRPLVAKDVFDGFDAAISARENRKEKAETTFVSIDRSVIEEAQMRGNAAQISVRFDVKLIHATRSGDGTVVEGNADKVIDLADVWTFARQVSSRDPNWQVIATETAS